MDDRTTAPPGRALEGEFCDIAASLGGDVAGREAGDEYLLSTHALYHGGPAPWALSPKIFDEGQVAILRGAAETMGRIMDKVTARYLESPSFRVRFGFSPELERLTLVPTGYERLIPLARVDVFFDEESGDFQFCELNTDGSAGMTNTVEITRAIQRTATFHEFSQRHPAIETFDVTSAWAHALLDTFRSWKMAATGAHAASEPSLAIVDYGESVSADEVRDFIDIFYDLGVYVRFTDIRDLSVGHAGGRDFLMDAHGPIDCVWRRAVTSEIMEKPCAGSAALEDAARRELVCVIGGYRTWPCATKAVFAILRSPEAADLLAPDEVDFVERHVPDTRVLDEGSDLSPYADRERWIVKPAGGYNGLGVVAGLDCDDGSWAAALSACARGGGVVQAYAPQYATPTIRGGALAEGEDPLDFRPAINMEGLYLFNGRFGGVFTRCGFANTIGEFTSRLNMGCLVVRE